MNPNIGTSTSIESFMQQLRSMGILGEQGLSSDYYGLADIEPDQLSQSIAQNLGITGQSGDVLESLVSKLTMSPLKGATLGSYSDVIQGGQSQWVNKMLDTWKSPQAKRAYGVGQGGTGFAASGAVDVYGKQIGAEYSKGMTDVLSGVYQKRDSSLNALNQWLQTNISNLQELT